MTNREIDALAAEHCMGRKVSWWSLHPTLHGDEFLPDADGDCPNQEMLVDGEWLYIERYSTDPAPSKQLRDRMRELGWQWGTRTAASGEYRCEFYKLPSTLDTYFEGFAATEEMAVALAALKALGIEVAA